MKVILIFNNNIESTVTETSQTVSVELDIPEAPRFTQTLQKELVVTEGTSTTLVCFVTGKPKPTITWYKVIALVVTFNLI